MFTKELKADKEKLFNHPVYKSVKSIKDLRVFMESHIFAVWDFMSLLKRLQRDFTCIKLPWAPPEDAQLAHLINDIVLHEESDLDANGTPRSHLEMYLDAMTEVNASTSQFNAFLGLVQNGTKISVALKNVGAPKHVSEFVINTTNIALYADPITVAIYFLHGRENIIPDMFSALIKDWNLAPDTIPNMIYYLKRHIELDGDEHGPAAKVILERLSKSTTKGRSELINHAHQAITSRIELWDGVLKSILMPTKQRVMS